MILWLTTLQPPGKKGDRENRMLGKFVMRHLLAYQTRKAEPRAEPRANHDGPALSVHIIQFFQQPPPFNQQRYLKQQEKRNQ